MCVRVCSICVMVRVCILDSAENEQFTEWTVSGLDCEDAAINLIMFGNNFKVKQMPYDCCRTNFVNHLKFQLYSVSVI